VLLIGKIGQDLLSSLPSDALRDPLLLRSFRDYLEDQLMARCELDSKLEVAEEGKTEFMYSDNGPLEVEHNYSIEDIRHFAKKCVDEFVVRKRIVN
jgi:hypothetical protein